MKTKKQFTSQANKMEVTGHDLSLLIVIPLLAIFLFAFSSNVNCNKSQDALAEFALLSPPLPPVISMQDPVFKEVDEMPQFKGGDAALLKYIAENTKYPEKAKLNRITGKVIVKLVVEKNCSVSNVEIMKGVDPLLDAEAIKVVSSLPPFEKAGKKDGKKVRVSYMIPITFTLN